jgi:hypothetical protein
MNNLTQFDLLYGTLEVGRIKKAFCNDETWYGVFEPQLKATDGVLAERLLSYINFTKQWNERLRKGVLAEPAEFDRFDDIVKSALWATRTTEGGRNTIVDAPVFFEGGDITWRTY